MFELLQAYRRYFLGMIGPQLPPQIQQSAPTTTTATTAPPPELDAQTLQDMQQTQELREETPETPDQMRLQQQQQSGRVPTLQEDKQNLQALLNKLSASPDGLSERDSKALNEILDRIGKKMGDSENKTALAGMMAELEAHSGQLSPESRTKLGGILEQTRTALASSEGPSRSSPTETVPTDPVEVDSSNPLQHDSDGLPDGLEGPLKREMARALNNSEGPRSQAEELKALLAKLKSTEEPKPALNPEDLAPLKKLLDGAMERLSTHPDVRSEDLATLRAMLENPDGITEGMRAALADIVDPLANDSDGLPDGLERNIGREMEKALNTSGDVEADAALLKSLMAKLQQRANGEQMDPPPTDQEKALLKKLGAGAVETLGSHVDPGHAPLLERTLNDLGAINPGMARVLAESLQVVDDVRFVADLQARLESGGTPTVAELARLQELAPDGDSRPPIVGITTHDATAETRAVSDLTRSEGRGEGACKIFGPFDSADQANVRAEAINRDHGLDGIIARVRTADDGTSFLIVSNRTQGELQSFSLDPGYLQSMPSAPPPVSSGIPEHNGLSVSDVSSNISRQQSLSVSDARSEDEPIDLTSVPLEESPGPVSTGPRVAIRWADAEPRQEHETLLVQARDHLAAVGDGTNPLSTQQRELLTRLSSADGVPSTKDMKELKGIVDKLKAHVQGDVLASGTQDVTTTKRFLGLVTRPKSLTQLVQTRERLSQNIDRLSTMMQDNPAQARRMGITQTQVDHLKSQVAKIDGKLSVKNVQSFQRFASTQAQRDTVVQLCARDPNLLQNLISDRTTSPKLLERLAENFGGVRGNRDVAAKIAQHPNATTAALQHVIRHNPNDVSLQRLLVTHANVGAETLEALARSTDQNVLRGVAQHPNAAGTTLQGLTSRLNLADPRSLSLAQALATNPHTPPAALATLAGHNDPKVQLAAVNNDNASLAVYEKLLGRSDAKVNPAAVTAALQNIPSLSSLSSATIENLRVKSNTALVNEITARVTAARDEIGTLSSTTRPRVDAVHSARTAARQQATDLLGLLQKVTPSQFGLREQIQSQLSTLMFDANTKLKPIEDRIDRPRITANALESIRSHRDQIQAQSDKLNMDDLSRSSVQTMSRLQNLRTQIDRGATLTMTDLNEVYTHSLRHGAPSEVLQMLDDQRASFRGLPLTVPDDLSAHEARSYEATRLTDRLTELKGSNAGLEGRLTEAVARGDISTGEKSNLMALARNTERTLEAYIDTAVSIHERGVEIRGNLSEMVDRGGLEQAQVANTLLSETVDRLTTDFPRLLDRTRSTRAIDAGHVQRVKDAATSLVQVEVTRLIQAEIDSLGVVAHPDLRRYLELQVEKLKFADDPDKLALVRVEEATVKAKLTPDQMNGLLDHGEQIVEDEHGNALPPENDVGSRVDAVLTRYQAVVASANQRLEEIGSNRVPVHEKAAMIRDLVETAGSGGTDSWQLRVQVRTPIPGLSVDGRGKTEFKFERNSETGQVDVIQRYEGGLGASYGTGNIGASLEAFGGLQTRWSFNSPEDAAKFCHFVETGQPADFIPPNPSKAGFAGGKALVQASLPSTLSVTGEVSLQGISERRPNGQDYSTLQGQVRARLDMGSTHIGGHLEASITYQNRSVSVNGMRTPEHDRTLTTVEVSLGAHAGLRDMDAILNKILLATSVSANARGGTQTAARQLELSDSTGDKRAYLAQRLVSALSASNVSVGALLRVEFQNGEPIGFSVGVKAATRSQQAVELGVVRVEGTRERELHAMTTLWVPQSAAGLERMRDYFVADPALAQRTMESAGWTDTTVIEGKTVAQWKGDWQKARDESSAVDGLKQMFLQSGGRVTEEYTARVTALGGRDAVVNGRSISAHESQWRSDDLGEHAMLQDLRSQYMADHTLTRSTYRTFAEERGMTGSLVFSDHTVIQGRQLHEWEAQWATEQTSSQARRKLRDDLT